MAYGFNDDKSKEEVYSKAEVNSLFLKKSNIKRLTVEGSAWDIPASGIAHAEVSYSVPEGFAPIGASVIQNTGIDYTVGVMLGLPGRLIFSTRGSGTARRAIPKAVVFFIDDDFITV